MNTAKHLKINNVNWCKITSHVSEFVRLDEQLRLKFIELETFSTSTDGWTPLAGQEVLLHKRLIANMRSYLHSSGSNIFKCRLFSFNEYQNLCKSFTFQEDFLQPGERQTMEEFIQEQIDLVLSTLLDRMNSVSFFEKLVDSILLQTAQELNAYQRSQMVQAITKKFEFIATLH